MGGFQDASFFDFDNDSNYRTKEQISKICFEELLKWIDKDGVVAIFDSTNSNIERRIYLKNKSKHRNIIFLELITDDEVIIKKNLNLKLISPDYIDKDPKYALEDFNKRHEFYSKQYATIEDSEDVKYIKIKNFTEKLVIRKVFGINESLIISYLMNLRLNSYPIYLSRHGESINNVNKVIGGDCLLSENGNNYAIKIHDYITAEIKEDFVIFTSCLKRTKKTAELFTQKKIETRLLNEIHGGICENMTYYEIEEKYPEIMQDRKADKLRYRYPEGESYLDLIERLKYFVLQLRSYKKPILIVAHNAIIRVLLGYFQEIPHEEIPLVDVNLHEVIKLTPNSKNYLKEIIKL
jgi:6-phosphofructo-2-kinase/fructose-2,6-biphosphatase 2